MKLGFNKVFGYYIEVSKQSNENIRITLSESRLWLMLKDT